ncbi:unnamed protein product, partial [Plutella xylostella]
CTRQCHCQKTQKWKINCIENRGDETNRTNFYLENYENVVVDYFEPCDLQEDINIRPRWCRWSFLL